MNRYGQNVCLNMIVKNEAAVIARCLASVRPLIDSWAIVDTGSSDGTQEIVRDAARRSARRAGRAPLAGLWQQSHGGAAPGPWARGLRVRH